VLWEQANARGAPMPKRKPEKKKPTKKKKRSTKKKKHKFDAEALKRIVNAGVKSGILKSR
jgi:hypothetical protein